MSPGEGVAGGWRPVSSMPAERLVDARLQLHWAAQLLSGFGSTLVAPQADDSHSNLGWLDSPATFLTHPARQSALRAALAIESFGLALLDAQGATLAAHDLAGSTLEASREWLETAVGEALGAAVPLALRDYDMPRHAVADGAAFVRPDPAALEQLAAWFANGYRGLEGATVGISGADPVRCWPHHFDVGTLITLESGDPETSRSIGLGLSPGDGSSAAPYWYVNPYPNPSAPGLPDLPEGGYWHSDGWVGAVLSAAAASAGTADQQERRATAFLSGAVEACRTLLA